MPYDPSDLRTSLATAAPARARLTFRIRLTQTPHYESDEWQDGLLSVDGRLVGANGADYLRRIAGDGNGGAVAESDAGRTGSGRPRWLVAAWLRHRRSLCRCGDGEAEVGGRGGEFAVVGDEVSELGAERVALRARLAALRSPSQCLMKFTRA